MNAKLQLIQINDSAKELIASIENESWDDAMHLSQQWDTRIRDLICNMSAEQFITMESQIVSLVDQNMCIKKRLVNLRAKVLTQLQENNTSRSAIQSYNNVA
ncbi:MAG: hypothetical protein ACRBDX_05635 [Gammaproteobacteria bacterium]